MQIKDMETSEEIEGKAYVHYQAWQEAYADLLPQEFLVNRTLENCQEMAHTYPENTLIALVDDQVVGFACYGKSSSEDLPQTGELYALYVLKEHHGQGIGYALMQAALEKLQSYDQVCLWVLEGNNRTIDFYEQVGFVFDGVTKEVHLGKPCTEYRMIFRRN